MNYSTNRSRNLGNTRSALRDAPVYVRCMICGCSEPADGRSAVRVSVERGVKSVLGYTGPSQTWLCSDCVCNYGTAITREQVLSLSSITDEFESELSSIDNVSVESESGMRKFWIAALASGAVALIGWALLS